VVNHVFDISEIKHNEEALANSVSLHNLLMDKSVDAIWRVELTTPMCINLTIDEQVEHLLHNAVFAEHNPAYATSLGLTGADITGKSL
jgi:PAS domain-containing protein